MNSNDLEQAITDSFYKELNIPDQRQVNAFKQYQKIIHYALHMGELNNILEIGAGVSTILFAQLARYRKCKVYSIDMSLGDFWSNVKKTRFYEIVKKNISFLEGSSISKSDFESFYKELPKQHIGGISFELIKDNLHRYVKSEFGIRKWEKLAGSLNVSDVEHIDVKQIFFSQEGLIIPEKILEMFSQEGDDFDYFQHAVDENTLLNKLVSKVDYFDLVFFDSGEFSSYPEWIILKDYIRKGGIAVFHDIYFPKSFKNFLVCATLCADPQWEIIYQDDTTPQGLLIGMRK